MKPKLQLVMCFAVAGLLGGLVATLFLFSWAGSENVDLIVGFGQSWVLALFPFAAALIAASYAALFDPQSFGPVLGGMVSFLAFITFSAIIAAVGGTGIWGFLAYLFYGSMFFGWALVLIGMTAGWFFRRMVRRAL